MYRVYDTKTKQWMQDGFYLSPYDNLNKVEKALFGSKMSLVPDCRYTFQRDIGLKDKNNKLIFEGDILQTETGMIGLVAYAPEMAAFVLLNYKQSKHYSLGAEICKQLTIIGNNFENLELILERKVEYDK